MTAGFVVSMLNSRASVVGVCGRGGCHSQPRLVGVLLDGECHFQNPLSKHKGFTCKHYTFGSLPEHLARRCCGERGERARCQPHVQPRRRASHSPHLRRIPTAISLTTLTTLTTDNCIVTDRYQRHDSHFHPSSQRRKASESISSALRPHSHLALHHLPRKHLPLRCLRHISAGPRTLQRSLSASSHGIQHGLAIVAGVD